MLPQALCFLPRKAGYNQCKIRFQGVMLSAIALMTMAEHDDRVA
jgi:hypothetical protein